MGARRVVTAFIALWAAGCARGSAGDSRFDASTGAVGRDDGGSAGDGTSQPGDGTSQPGDGATGDGATGDGQPTEPTCGPDTLACDGGSSEVDAQVSPPDAGHAHDAGTRHPQSGSFRVMQTNAALQAPLSTEFTLEVGDQVSLRATGNIWPGLVAQGCCGPTGTSGAHTGANWPLQGGPDFALVAYVNGQWRYVGSEQNFVVTVPGVLKLGTNDDNNQTGDDCTSVGELDRGFTVAVTVTP